MRSDALDLYGGEVLPLAETGAALCHRAEAGDVVLGYSMGGRIALHALVQADAPWSKAVIISADPGSGEDPERVASDRAWATLVRGDWGRFCEEWGRQPVFGGAEMPWRREGASPRRREAIARGFEEWSVGRQQDLRGAIGRSGIPVLWIVGERDQKFCRLAETLPANVRVERIAAAGHRVPWEQPEAVVGAIQSFLS